MGDRRFDADNDKGRPDLGTLRVRELVDRVSGWCQTGALADRVVFEETRSTSTAARPALARVRKYDLRRRTARRTTSGGNAP
jgi:hypothetical protein